MLALLNVAEILLPTVTQTISSVPAWKSRSNASLNVPALAAAVVGSGAPGASIFSQKASAERSTPASNSSSPNRTMRGTIVIPRRRQTRARGRTRNWRRSRPWPRSLHDVGGHPADGALGRTTPVAG